MAGLLTITTPKGVIQQLRTADASVRLEFRWNPGFGPEWTGRLNSAQAKFDAEVLRRTEPYVPFETGLLAHSAMMSSDVGGGLLEWATPYAAAQYYATADSRIYDPLRGAHWGQRMIAGNQAALAAFARKAVAK